MADLVTQRAKAVQTIADAISEALGLSTVCPECGERERAAVVCGCERSRALRLVRFCGECGCEIDRGDLCGDCGVGLGDDAHRQGVWR